MTTDKTTTKKSQAEIEYERIMRHRMQSPKQAHGRDFGTNWSPDGQVKHTKRETMMGEGLGSSLGLDSPKHTRSYREGEIEMLEIADLQYREEMRFQQSLKRQKQNAITTRFQQNLSAKVNSGKILVDQRIFLAFPKKDWSSRAEKLGGIPEGVDIAMSKFGHLVIVPVIEAKESTYKDSHGRSFQIDPTIRATVNQIFGAVQWTKPLTIEDARQFGVNLE